MSIVSGLATATGVSPLLNAPRDAAPELKVGAADRRAERPATQGTSRPIAVRFVPRPVLELGSARAKSATEARKPSGDSRYARFIDAVLALRLDHDLTLLPKYRAAEVMQAGREIFKMDDGLPKAVRPQLREPEPRFPTAEDGEKPAPATMKDDAALAQESAAPAVPEPVIAAPDQPAADVNAAEPEGSASTVASGLSSSDDPADPARDGGDAVATDPANAV